MKRILSLLFPALMVVLMLSACGSSDQIQPVLYDLFDTYTTTDFPQSPWIGFTRTSLPDIWTNDSNWSIQTDGSATFWAQLTVPSSGTQNSAFLNSNYNKTDVDCSINTRMLINSSDLTTVQLGVILRADSTTSAHYAFVYLGMQVGSDPLNPSTLAPTVQIQKVDAGGTITPLGTASISSYEVTLFDPTAAHTYHLSVSGTTPLTFIASVDGVQQLPAVYDSYGNVIIPASDPIIDDGITYGAVYHLGEPGFFVANANTAQVFRFFIFEP